MNVPKKTNSIPNKCHFQGENEEKKKIKCKFVVEIMKFSSILQLGTRLSMAVVRRARSCVRSVRSFIVMDIGYFGHA